MKLKEFDSFPKKKERLIAGGLTALESEIFFNGVNAALSKIGEMEVVLNEFNLRNEIIANWPFAVLEHDKVDRLFKALKTTPNLIQLKEVSNGV